MYGLPSGIYIDGFILGSINNVGSGSTPVPGYTNYQNTGPNSITSVTPGGSYPVTITAGPVIPLDGEPVYYAIWVDLDHDLDYEANERILLTTTVVPNEVAVVNLEIPADALAGYTGLRVMCVFDFAAPNDACGSYNWGETEDYTLVIDDGAPCIPMYGYGSIDGDYITDFVLENVVNQATGGDTYTDYGAQGLVIHLAPGTEYFPIITSGTYDPAPGHYEYLSVWIDLDQNGTFEPDEKLTVATTEAPFESVTPSLFIPTDAPTGYTRMRVMCVHNEDPTDACGIYFYGETEDYTIVIDDGSPCIPVFAYQGSDGDYVSAVQLADLNWSLAPGEEPQGYLPPVYGAHLSAGYTGTLTVTSGSYANDFLTAWLDLDGDGFSGDLIGEQVVNSPFATATFPVNIPDDFVGYAVLRVICSSAIMD
ncbi:MAG: hypothetical protein IT229_09120, partial [Flavobacteriales bacterium]|nr:hypothetical protein [Flavobacteriales bacterium]